MLKFNAAYLAMAGAAVGAALVGVVIWIQTTPQPPAPLATAPAPEAAAPAVPAPAEPAPAAPATETAKVDAKSDRPKAPAEMTVPSFDLLRVEPDGSTVIAGKGEPNTKLDIMNGDTVIATAEIGPSGDFAAVLDTPLEAGDYQLTLRAAGPDGAAVASEEVATVSIPKDGGAGLLAMVTKPGEASRILTQPEAPAAPQPEAPAAPQAETPAAPAATAEAPAEAPVAQQETASAAGALTLPDLPAAALDIAGNAPAATAVAPAPEQVVSAPAAPETPKPAIDAAVRVDAVEIEGDKLFVAGSATPGFSVRVLADDVAVGTAKASPAGRFIVEAVAALSVGDHTITAELIEPGSSTVVQRATVPFNRPEGAAMAAVAGAPAAAPAQTPQPTVEAPAGSLVLPAIADMIAARDDAAAALAEFQKLTGPEAAATPADLAASQAGLAAKLEAMIAKAVPETAPAEEKAKVEEMKANARAALTAITAAGPIDPAALPDVEAMKKLRDGVGAAMAAIAPTAAPEAPPAAPVAPAAVAETATPPAPATPAAPSTPAPDIAAAPAAPAADAPAASGPVTIQQEPLTPSAGSVIIRRGDTLWQISRRTYGQGVRYTTIYLANQQQIGNPDRIAPGQIFSVPDTPIDNAEEMHRKLLDDKKSNVRD